MAKMKENPTERLIKGLIRRSFMHYGDPDRPKRPAVYYVIMSTPNRRPIYFGGGRPTHDYFEARFFTYANEAREVAENYRGASVRKVVLN